MLNASDAPENDMDAFNSSKPQPKRVKTASSYHFMDEEEDAADT